jgi:hypothetical protein
VCTADLGFTGGKNDIGAGTDTDFIGACTPALSLHPSENSANGGGGGGVHQLTQRQCRIGLGLPTFTSRYSFDINTLHFLTDSVTPNINQFTIDSFHDLNLTARVAVDYSRLS